MTQSGLELLTFSINGIMLGADTSQVAGILEPEAAEEEGLRLCRFMEEVRFQGGDVAFAAPKVLKIRTGAAFVGVVVDMPEEIISVSLDSIRPLPYLVKHCARSKAVWGAALTEKGLIMLVDFQKMLPQGANS